MEFMSVILFYPELWECRSIKNIQLFAVVQNDTIIHITEDSMAWINTSALSKEV